PCWYSLRIRFLKIFLYFSSSFFISSMFSSITAISLSIRIISFSAFRIASWLFLMSSSSLSRSFLMELLSSWIFSSSCFTRSLSLACTRPAVVIVRQTARITVNTCFMILSPLSVCRFIEPSPLRGTPGRPERLDSVVVHRILRDAVFAHFEMQVGTGGSSVVSDGGDALSLADALAGRHQDGAAVHVAVDGGQSAAVVDDDHPAIAAGGAAFLDDSGCGGVDR